MSILQRAYCHTKRKWDKSLILLGIILVISTLFLVGTSIRTATETASFNVRQSLQGGFTIDARFLGKQFTESVVEKILSMDGVRADYNAHSRVYAEFLAINKKPLTVRTEGAFHVSDGFEHTGRLMADIFSDKSELFTEYGFELTEGRHIYENTQSAGLVHQWLANENNLTVGDTLFLSLNDEAVEVEIIGIFANTVPQDTDMIMSHMFYENVVFTDPHSFNRLFNDRDMLSFQRADFTVIDPAELDNIITAVRNIPNIDWERAAFIRRDVEFQNARSALETLGNMVDVMIWVILVVSLVLLIFILALWIRERVHETGVFLSIGFSKGNILLQQIAEVMIVATLAFILSFGVSTLIGQTIGNTLLEQASAPEFELVSLAEEATLQEEISLVEIDVSITAMNYILMWIVGSLLCIVAVIFATFPVLRMKPKNILSQMT